MASETTPEAGTVSYTYTSNDQMATSANANGKITTLSYNTRNQVTAVSYRDQEKDFPGEAPTERYMIAQGATLGCKDK